MFLHNVFSRLPALQLTISCTGFRSASRQDSTLFLCDAELDAARSHEHNILRWPAGVVVAGVIEGEEIVVVLSHAAIVVAEVTEEEIVVVLPREVTVVVLLLGAAVVTLLPEEIAVVSFRGEAEEDVVHLLRWKSCKWS